MTAPASRSVQDAIEGRRAPLAPGGDGLGRLLKHMERGQCRFPIRGQGAATGFCGAAVDEWRPGVVHGCYCATHRAFVERAG